jgi:RHS repeat-associated protein
MYRVYRDSTPLAQYPALPTRFKRVRGGNQLVSYEFLVGEDGRIAAKHESVAGRASYFIYEYDDSGHLLRAWRDGKLSEEYAYDPKGARIASWNPRQGQWKYGYDDRGRLTSAGPWKFSYAGDGSLREAWTPELSFFLGYNQEGGLSRIVLPGGQVLRSESVAPGLPTEKYLDAVPAESLTWRSPLQLATYRDHRAGTRMQFHHTGQGRLPQAVTIQTPQGATNYLLGYDQVGSLKAVAAMDGPHEGRVVKVMDYDAFGNILADTNPGLFMPLSFAGGLRDRFTGLVRFCHRDYDPTVGRFTAPDPLGDTGGDHDLYDYCVDEPVGSFDPSGLVSENVQRAEDEARGKVQEEAALQIGQEAFSKALEQEMDSNQAPEAMGQEAAQVAWNEAVAKQNGGGSSQPSATPSAETGKYAIFDKKKGTLEVHDGQGVNTWNATSGPHGKGALPPGNYTIGGEFPKTSSDKPFCDAQGNCFSFPITPNFKTDRFGLAIHPDGNKPGTEGCIGVEDANTSPLWKSLGGMKGKQVEVR